MFCIYCGAKNPDDAVFCKQCGKRLRETPEPSTQEAAKIEETTTSLPFPTRDAPRVSHDPRRAFAYKHSKLGWAIIGVTLAIVIALIVGVIITYVGNPTLSLGYTASPTPAATTAAPVDASAVVGSWAGHCADPGGQTFDSVWFHADGSGTFGNGEYTLQWHFLS